MAATSKPKNLSQYRAPRAKAPAAPLPARRQPEKTLPQGVIANDRRGPEDKMTPDEVDFYRAMINARQQAIIQAVGTIDISILTGFLSVSGANPEHVSALKAANAGIQLLFDRYGIDGNTPVQPDGTIMREAMVVPEPEDDALPTDEEAPPPDSEEPWE